MLLERGADPNKRFPGQFHSTPMPNTDRFDNTPFFRAAVAADVEALKVLVGHGAKLDQMPPVEAEPERKPGDITVGGRRANPNAGRTAAMVAMTGGRGPAMTGGPGVHPRRRGAVSRAGQPQARRRVRVAARGGREPEREGARRRDAAAPGGARRQPRDDSRAGQGQGGLQPEEQRRLHRARRRRRQAACGRRGSRARGGPPGGGRGRGRGASQQDVAKLLRELMGLPPAPAHPTEPARGRTAVKKVICSRPRRCSSPRPCRRDQMQVPRPAAQRPSRRSRPRIAGEGGRHDSAKPDAPIALPGDGDAVLRRLSQHAEPASRRRAARARQGQPRRSRRRRRDLGTRGQEARRGRDAAAGIADARRTRS